MTSVLEWLDEWIRTPGFGGAAAVVAACVALWGATRERRSSEIRERETRWWEQARWATSLLTSSDENEVSLGIAALDQLVEEGTDEEASRFAMKALLLVLVESVDEESDDDAHWTPTHGGEFHG